jgi:hypothetical protein
MPKLACPCGFVHNLSAIPDDGWRAIRDQDLEAYVQHHRAYAEGFSAPEGSPERKASNIGGQETLRMRTLLYVCPQCGRIRWRNDRSDDFHTYVPEDEATRAQALALAAAAEFQQEQEAVRAEAIRVHNRAAQIVAQRMASHGLRCPYCFQFSKKMPFVERGSVWSFFQCPACSRTFRLERFGAGQAGAATESEAPAGVGVASSNTRLLAFSTSNYEAMIKFLRDFGFRVSENPKGDQLVPFFEQKRGARVNLGGLEFQLEESEAVDARASFNLFLTDFPDNEIDRVKALGYACDYESFGNTHTFRTPDGGKLVV